MFWFGKYKKSGYCFPESSLGFFSVVKRLKGVKREEIAKNNLLSISWLRPSVHPIAARAFRYFLRQNPNNLGNWTTNEVVPYGTHQLEREIITEMADLYHADVGTIEGYITSGGTEGNLYSVWVGKKFLEKSMQSLQICLIKNDLTHYSVVKAADIVGISVYNSSLCRKAWNFDPQSIGDDVIKLYKEGYRGFLIPITIGYTTTGTTDNFDSVFHIIRELESKHSDLCFFVWVDASFNGLINPFIDKTFRPFSFPIKALIVDFHKFGGTPYPSGVILYRKNLRQLIERSVDYLPFHDSVVLGSRSGAAVAAIWAVIHFLGKKGFLHAIEKQFKNKFFFIKGIMSIFPGAEIVTSVNSLSCGVIFHSIEGGRLNGEIEQRYGLFTKDINYSFAKNKKENLRLYKFYFLPRTKKKILHRFLIDLQSKYEIEK